MNFDCTIEREGRTVVLAPDGDLDVTSAPLLRQVIQQVLDHGGCDRIDVDLAKVTFLDSSGLGMLVAAQRASGARGVPFWLTRPGPMVRMVLEVTNLYQHLVAQDAEENLVF
ncbi:MULTISPECIES: STAS domain-containing protein [Actinoplanes]|uniref:STAS domain-containing protein n=1 Tax=Actinoplanes TaxID=1865 RepID=UPI0005F28621|nr:MULTISPECIES: STAS domain-containing protein [Actinoplanes]GLY03861.1 anti-sigma factor antagonist [Actinoplanes sp. NBRC 101535]